MLKRLSGINNSQNWQQNLLIFWKHLPINFVIMNKFINKLYTYKCLFEHNNMTLNLNSTNFKDIALKEGFLKDTSLRKENNFVTKETEFASRELFFAKPVLIFLFHCYFHVFIIGMFCH